MWAMWDGRDGPPKWATVMGTLGTTFGTLRDTRLDAFQEGKKKKRYDGVGLWIPFVKCKNPRPSTYPAAPLPFLPREPEWGGTIRR